VSWSGRFWVGQPYPLRASSRIPRGATFDECRDCAATFCLHTNGEVPFDEGIRQAPGNQPPRAGCGNRSSTGDLTYFLRRVRDALAEVDVTGTVDLQHNRPSRPRQPLPPSLRSVGPGNGPCSQVRSSSTMREDRALHWLAPQAGHPSRTRPQVTVPDVQQTGFSLGIDSPSLGLHNGRERQPCAPHGGAEVSRRRCGATHARGIGEARLKEDDRAPVRAAVRTHRRGAA
jgi:hypothetical protein